MSLLLGLPGAAHPDELPPELQGREAARDERDLVYTASKRLERVGEAPAIVQVVTADQLFSLGYRTVNDALRYLTGFDVVQGTRLSRTFLRGVPDSLLVLLDGVPLNSPLDNIAGTALDFGLSLSYIDRIEVVTAPGGVLWGANTFLGIVNLISRSGAQQGVRVQAGGGRFHYGEVSAVGAWTPTRVPGLSLVLAASAVTNRDPSVFLSSAAFNESTAGDRGRVDAAPEYYVDLFAKLSYGDFTLTIRHPFLHNAYSISDYGGLLRRGFAGYEEEPRRLYALTWRRELLDGKLELRARGRHLWVPDSFLNRLFPPQPDYYPLGLQRLLAANAFRTGADFEVRARAFQGNDLIVGLDYSWERVSEATVRVWDPRAGGSQLQPQIPTTDQNVVGVYAHDEQKLGRWLTLSGGVRYHYASLWGGLLRGAGALVFSPLDRLHLKVNYSEGFRPPPIYALRGLPASGYIGSQVTAEQSRAVQAEIYGTPVRWLGPVKRLALRAGYTYARIDGLLVFNRFIGSTAATVDNADDSLVIHSVDASAELEASHARAWLRASYKRIDQTSTDQQFLTPVPDLILNGGLQVLVWSRPRIEPYATAVYLSRIEAQGVSTGFNQARGPIFLLEAGVVARRLPYGLELGVHVQNLTGVAYSEPNQLPLNILLPQPGTSAFARAAWSWH